MPEDLNIPTSPNPEQWLSSQPPIPPSQPPKKNFLKKVVKFLLVIFVLIAVVVGGYFVLSQYFPQYAKYVQPYVGPVLDPLMEMVGLAQPGQPSAENLAQPTPVTPTATASPTVSSTPSTANWKTYRNYEYGFEFKYPENWEISKPDNKILYLFEKTEEYPGGGITISRNNGKLGDIRSNLSPDLVLMNSETRLINNIQWDVYILKEKIDLGLTFINFYTQQGDYIISFGAIDRSITTNLLDQILSTFKLPPDADKDGLPDGVEPTYKTNPNNPDTDGDGYLDGQEVQNGYNPLGPGRAAP